MSKSGSILRWRRRCCGSRRRCRVLGNIHTLWLFNVVVTAVCVGLVYLILRQLDFGDGAATLVAVTAGLGTNLWAYSQTFFREPLAMLFILLALLAAQIARRRSAAGRLISLALAAACLALAVLTKWSAIMALPGLIALALPGTARVSRRLGARLAGLILAGSVLTLVYAMLADPMPALVQDLLAQFGWRDKYINDALRAYFLSPGASLWATSPILLLALVGGAMLWRAGRVQLVLAIWLIVFAYGLGHAISTDRHWTGGLSFPPRFLTPAIPALILLTAPVARALLNGRRWTLRALWAVLLMYGIWIQFSAVSLDWRHFGESLPAASGGLAEWEPASWQPQYFRWFVLPQRWGDLGLNFLWLRAQAPIWAISMGLYAAVVGASLVLLLRRPGRRWRHAALPLVCLLPPLALLNLSYVYDRDPRTRSQQAALHAAIGYLEAQAGAEDALLLPGNDYGEFFLNHQDSSDTADHHLAEALGAGGQRPAAGRG